ncbi:MAG: DNA methyltransferase [Acidimicrobiia bacterium]
MLNLIGRGEIRVGKYNAALDTYTLNHWKPVPKEKAGIRRIRTVWWRKSHDAGTHGTTLISRLLGKRNVFPFPKSVYAVRDCLEAVVKNRPDALIVDFFAGSGTTLHSTLLLNQTDGGRRRCVLVTNNEVDPKTATALNKQGIYRGDPGFENAGIFEAATRPRVQTAITGVRPDGEPVPTGKRFRYVDGREFADGFEENVEFYRLDYLDPDQVELGEAFEAIHPALWLIAGGKAPRPGDVDPSKPFYVAERAGYAILFNDASLRGLEQALEGRDDVTHVFIVSDSEEAFIDARELIGHGRRTSMIYRDYLRTFRINTPRELS